jgi:DNA polymerase IV
VGVRIVLHADMDAFYASVEQRDRPELRGKPVIVGGSSRRGVVSAASYEARTFGVRSAMPGFRARELCPQGVFLPPNMEKYARVSAQVQAIFEGFTPLVEPLSLDEAFLDITGSVGLFGGAMALGQALRARVRDELGLAVSCGIAENKLVAKIACGLAKPDGLRLVPPEQTRALLAPLAIGNLWGVGPETEAQLTAAGVHTIGDFAACELPKLRRVLGDRSVHLQALARGEDDRPVEPNREAKSYGEENTFERDVTEREVVTHALTSHAQAVARRLRSDRVLGRTVTLKVKLGRARARRASRSEAGEVEPSYPVLTRSRTLAEATDDGAVLRRHVIELWDEARIAEPVRLLGVSVSQLQPRGEEQLGLFAEGREERSKKLGPALDAIRKRFGDGVLGVAEAEPEKLTPSTRRKRGT